MREILFRGKSLRSGNWVEGSLLIFPKTKRAKILVYEEADLDFNNVEVDPATVGQYTGLTDKNGKRIFEGDVIECWSEGVKARGTVQQNRGGLWIIYPAWQKIIMWGLCPNEDGSTDVEIIGTVHDNPELLKGGEQ